MGEYDIVYSSLPSARCLFSFIMVKLALVVFAIMVMQISGVSAQCDCDMEIEDAASSTDNLLLDVQADLLDQMGELFDWISELKHTLHRHPPRPRPGYGYKKPVYGYKPAPTATRSRPTAAGRALSSTALILCKYVNKYYE